MKNDSLQPSDQRRQLGGLPHELLCPGEYSVIACRRFFRLARPPIYPTYIICPFRKDASSLYPKPVPLGAALASGASLSKSVLTH